MAAATTIDQAKAPYVVWVLPADLPQPGALRRIVGGGVPAGLGTFGARCACGAVALSRRAVTMVSVDQPRRSVPGGWGGPGLADPSQRPADHFRPAGRRRPAGVCRLLIEGRAAAQRGRGVPEATVRLAHRAAAATRYAATTSAGPLGTPHALPAVHDDSKRAQVRSSGSAGVRHRHIDHGGHRQPRRGG